MTALALDPTRPAGAPARPLAWLRHSLVLARRSLLTTLRTPEALIDVTLQPVIFLVLFVFVFGGAISGGDRHAYLQYVLPGLLVQSVLFGSASIGVTLNTDKGKGVADRFRSLPIARSAPLVGAVAADLLRYAVLAVVLLGTGALLGFRPSSAVGALTGVLVCVAFALCLSWVSVWVGMTARSPGAVQGITFLVMSPLTFGSSTYVPVGTLPGWLQAFVHANPATPLVDAARGLMVGGAVGRPLLLAAAWAVGLVAVFAPLAVRAYRRAG